VDGKGGKGFEWSALDACYLVSFPVDGCAIMEPAKKAMKKCDGFILTVFAG
jgi:hypothetical protein